MTVRVRFSAMRSLFVLAASLLCFATLHAAVDEPRRKKGGFTGATPKPAVKRSAADDSIPAPERSVDRESTPRPKKSPPPESTPKPKKISSEEENAPLPKRSADAGTPKPKKSTAAESTPKPRKADVESTPAPTKKKPAAIAADEKKPEPTEPSPKTAETEPPAKREHAPAATLEPSELAEFATLPPGVQSLITAALELTKLNLTYTYGSSDPAQGGMDCSGTMFHLLNSQGFKNVPRDSSSQYVWARKAGPFFAVVSKSAESFEFKDLQPGDLLFWTGTYQTGREIPVSHVMLYLGTEKKRKKRVMFGASDGRSYDGIQRWGVSVFDFKMPNNGTAGAEGPKVDFIGYGKIPSLREIPSVVAEVPPAVAMPPVQPSATPARRSSVSAASSTPRPRKKRTSQ